MEEIEGGKYVLWEDYAALLEKADRLDIEVQRLTTALRTCDRILKPMREKAQKENESR